MRHPQVIIHESDGRLAAQLRDLWDHHRWVVRQPGRAETIVRLGRSGAPTVLVLKLGGRPAADLALLERLTWLMPDLAAVVVGDRADPALNGLAWDLGAAYVWLSPELPPQLPEVVAGLMAGAMARHQASLGRIAAASRIGN